MEDCLREFACLNVRAEGGGVDRPSAELRGDVKAEADTGEFSTEGMLLSES